MEERVPNGTIVRDNYNNYGKKEVEYTIIDATKLSTILMEDGRYLYKFKNQFNTVFWLYRYEFTIVSTPPIIKKEDMNTEMEINSLKDQINSLKMDIGFLNDSIIKMVNTQTMIIDTLRKLIPEYEGRK